MRQMEANASEGGLKIKACVCAPPVYMHLCTGLFYGVHASCCPSHDTYNIKASGLARVPQPILGNWRPPRWNAPSLG